MTKQISLKHCTDCDWKSNATRSQKNQRMSALSHSHDLRHTVANDDNTLYVLGNGVMMKNK